MIQQTAGSFIRIPNSVAPHFGENAEEVVFGNHSLQRANLHKQGLCYYITSTYLSL